MFNEEEVTIICRLCNILNIPYPLNFIDRIVMFEDILSIDFDEKIINIDPSKTEEIYFFAVLGLAASHSYSIVNSVKTKA